MKQAKIITLLTATALLAGCSNLGSNSTQAPTEETTTRFVPTRGESIMFLIPIETTTTVTEKNTTTSKVTTTTTTATSSPKLNVDDIIYVYEEPGEINSSRNGFLAMSSTEFNKLKHEDVLKFFKQAIAKQDVSTQKSVAIYFTDKGTAIQVRGAANIFTYGTYDISVGTIKQIGEEGYIYNEKTKQYYTSVTNQPFKA